MHRSYCWLALFLAAVLPARGFSVQLFELERWSDIATIIVDGSWDGKRFSPLSFSKGDQTAFSSLDQEMLRQSIQANLDRLPKEAHPDHLTLFATASGLLRSGIVAASPDGIWMLTGDGGMMEEWQKKTFSSAEWKSLLDAVFARKATREALVSMPSGPERARMLFDFTKSIPPAEDAENWERLLARTGSGFHLSALTNSGFRLSSEEMDALLDICDQSAPEDRLAALEILSYIPLDETRAGRLEAYLREAPGSPVRRKAIHALSRINTSKSKDILAGLLPARDADFVEVCIAIPAPAFQPKPQISQLSEDKICAVARDVMNDSEADESPQGPAILHLIKKIDYPPAMELMFQSAFRTDGRASAQAYSNLVEASGVDLGQDKPEAWRSWLKKSAPFLSPRYRINTPEAVDAWVRAWTSAPDDNIRRIMEKCSLDLTEPDFSRLFEQAQNPDSKGATKGILSTLWKTGVLPPEWRRTIVATFISPPTIQEKAGNKSWREIAFQSTRAFPFPDDLELEGACDLVIGESYQIDLSKQSNKRSYNLSNDMPWINIGGSFPGRPVARAAVEIWEKDPANPERRLWSYGWKAGPVTLSNRPK